MKEIKNIELVLENCEVIVVEKEHIGALKLSNVQRSIRRLATNSVSDILSVEEVFVQICSQANQLSAFSLSLGEETPFERLSKFADVAAISVHYEDGTEEYIFVDWNPDSEYVNSYQTNSLNVKTGDFYLVISAKEKVDTYFKKQLAS